MHLAILGEIISQNYEFNPILRSGGWVGVWVGGWVGVWVGGWLVGWVVGWVGGGGV